MSRSLRDRIKEVCDRYDMKFTIEQAEDDTWVLSLTGLLRPELEQARDELERFLGDDWRIQVVLAERS